MYTLMSNKQYYDALGTTGTIANTEGINSTYDITTETVEMFAKLILKVLRIEIAQTEWNTLNILQVRNH